MTEHIPSPAVLAHQLERVGTLTTALGECPVWDADRQLLWCMDCRAGLIYRVNPATGEAVSYQLPAPTGSFALNSDGRLIVALRQGLALYDPASAQLEPLAEMQDRHPNLRLNDGAAMPDGSYVVGSMHVFREPGEAPLGGLFRLHTDGRLERLAQDLAVVNGPVMHPSNGRLYVCDSAARLIYSYAQDDAGRLSDRQVFANTAELNSAPDGCCFDDQGGLWTALVHAAALVRLDAQGQVSHRIELPIAHPSSLCFGGPDLADLYITSIRDSGRLLAEGPLDGAVLKVSGSGFRGAARGMCSLRLNAD